jgi:hypothetical protein
MLLAAAACDKVPARNDVKLEVVKQSGYLKVLEGLRGKVVVVDIWGEF